MVLLQGPGALFLMSEVPLYCGHASAHGKQLHLQGYLAHKKTPPPGTLQ